jgi:hypothetical protein
MGITRKQKLITSRWLIILEEITEFKSLLTHICGNIIQCPHVLATTRSQKLGELFDAQIGLPQNRAQSSPVNLPVVWHDRLGEGVIPAHDDVASMLAPDGKSDFFKRPNNFRTGGLGQPAHTATKIASKCSSGTAKWSS